MMIDIFSCMDFCMLCNGYDTIQAYAKHEGIVIHVCEECAEGMTDKELVDAYRQARASASGKAPRIRRKQSHE